MATHKPQAMARLINEPDLRAGISAKALACVKEKYSLDAVTDQYLHLLGLAPRAE